MARRKPDPKGLRDLRNLPSNRWVFDNAGNGRREDMLDHHAPIGHYELDDVILTMTENGGIAIQRSAAENVAHARGLADVAGAMSIARARDELTAPSRWRDAMTLHNNLLEIREAARRVQLSKPGEIAPLIARIDDAASNGDEVRTLKDSVQHAEGVLDELLGEMRGAAEKVDRYLKRYRINYTPSSSEPLTNWFMICCAGSWYPFSGQWLNKGDRADFRRFLVAAWRDLQFPDPTDPTGAIKPVEDHIRERLAASDIFDHFGG